jgi:hypothetical protein
VRPVGAAGGAVGQPAMLGDVGPGHRSDSAGGQGAKGPSRAIARLIRCLKRPDEAVGSGAADALRGLDPPPVRDLIGALIKARDARFRVELIRVLGGLGEGYRAHATLALAQLWQGGDPAIRQAIVEAVLGMGPASLD